MPERFSMATEEHGEYTRVILRGELDMARADEVEAEIGRVGKAQGTRMIVVDLRDLTFLDSSGLRSIIMASAGSRREGIPLTVVRGPEQVQSVFEITGMDRELSMVDDPADPPPDTAGQV